MKSTSRSLYLVCLSFAAAVAVGLLLPAPSASQRTGEIKGQVPAVRSPLDDPFSSSFLLNPFGRNDPAQSLAESGPRFSDAYNMSAFTLLGLVKGNWPIVIDYQLERTGLIFVEINPSNAEPFYYRLDGTKTERQQVIFRLPGLFGTDLKAAVITVRALEDKTGEAKPVPFRLYGLGAGEKAVGSVAIDDVHFRPEQIRTKPKSPEKANYSFRSRSDFNSVDVEVRRVALKDGVVGTVLVKNNRLNKGVKAGASVPSDEQDKPRHTWDGKAKDGKISLGSHLVQVRGWRGLREGGDWVVAWSEEWVQVAE
jgi:hypothetical protein